MKIYRLILLILALIPSVCIAQTSLTKVLDSLDDSDKVRDVIYQEQRDPKTRRIYECKRIFTFTDAKLARRIIEAFKKERQNSTNYQVNVDNNSAVYLSDFRKGRDKTRFTLIKDGQKWTFIYQLVPSNRRFSEVEPSGPFRDKMDAIAKGQLALQPISRGKGCRSITHITFD